MSKWGSEDLKWVSSLSVLVNNFPLLDTFSNICNLTKYFFPQASYHGFLFSTNSQSKSYFKKLFLSEEGSIKFV